MELDALIKKMKQRPDLYVGDGGIPGLRHFLCGYIAAMRETNPAYEDWLFDGFTAYLSEKYRDDRSLDWASLISAHERDADSTKRFFELAEEYRSGITL